MKKIISTIAILPLVWAVLLVVAFLAVCQSDLVPPSEVIEDA